MSKVYQCPMCCQRDFPSKRDLKEHIIAGANAPVNCPFCSATFGNQFLLILHLDHCIEADDEEMDEDGCGHLTGSSSDSGEGELDFFCTQCQVSIADIHEHIRQYHSDQVVVVQDGQDGILLPPEVQSADPEDESGK